MTLVFKYIVLCFHNANLEWILTLFVIYMLADFALIPWICWFWLVIFILCSHFMQWRLSCILIWLNICLSFWRHSFVAYLSQDCIIPIGYVPINAIIIVYNYLFKEHVEVRFVSIVFWEFFVRQNEIIFDFEFFPHFKRLVSANFFIWKSQMVY
jgi:hypothetical protein